MNAPQDVLNELINNSKESVLTEWLAESFTGSAAAKSLHQGHAEDARVLLQAFQEGLQARGTAEHFEGAAWGPLRQRLAELSANRAAQGATAGDTSHFVLAMKKPLFAGVQKRFTAEPQTLMEAVWLASTLVDRMAQFTVTTYQRTREDIIRRQQQELLELSTPVVKLWEGVLAVPMIGTLDSSRTQLVMETLLQRIVETGSEIAIIDITGVPTVDTLVAQHLMKTVTAIRLMGAECIISGIRPQIAQTIVHLGIDLQGITTKASLADALFLAMRSAGYTVSRQKS